MARGSFQWWCGPEVLGELLVGGVLWKPGREGGPGVLGEVELEAVVGTLLPERGDAVVALQDEERQALLPQAGGHGEPRGPRADDDGPVHPHAPWGEEAVHSIGGEEHHGWLLGL